MADDSTSRDAGIALAGEFPPADRAAWEALAGDLDRLRSRSYDGLTIEPLYTADDAIDSIGLPGFPPFTRGRTAAGARVGGWDVRQIVDAAQGERGAVAELERGATSLLIPLRRAETIDADVLDRVLDGVLLDLAPVVLDAGRRWSQAAASLEALWQRRSVEPEMVSGSLGADPYGEWASHRSDVDLDDQLTVLATWATRLAGAYPNVRAVAIDGARFHDAGASDAQELGYTIANAVATLRAITTADRLEPPLDVSAAFAQMELRLAATADQFATIAKFRAARRLWARVAEIAGVPDAAAQTPTHAITSLAMMTRYDSAVNMLRGTVACFAAGVAGADAITVRPYDQRTAATGAEPSQSELGRRLARNTQSVLALESHLADVIDPAGGSWYVERLTADLAQAAWDVFQDVEHAGGFQAAVEAGIVNERIAEVRERRRSDVNRRAAPLTGVTEFPNIGEVLPPALDSLTQPTDGSLVTHRWAEDVEALRGRVDTAAAKGERPAVYLATIGSRAAFTARAMFAKNCFEVAGIAARFGTVTDDPAEIATAFGADGSTVACICSSDDVYAERGAAVAEALAAAGASRIYLAGTPKDLMERLTAAGVTHTIHAGEDVVALLTDLADHLGVA